MGKGQRLKEERRRQASALRVTVVAHPEQTEDSRSSSTNEMALVRAAVLYADSVVLSSQNHHFRELTDALQVGAYAVADYIVAPSSGVVESYLADTLTSDEDERNFRRSIEESRQKHSIPAGLDANELRRALRQAHRLDRHESELERAALAAENGLTDAKTLEARGLLKISKAGLDWGKGDPMLAFNEMAWTIGWWEELLTRVQDGSTRLLLDQRSQTAVRTAIDLDLVRPSALFEEHSSTVLTGAGLIARLPAFPTVPMDELLDLRNDLGDPLTNYRAAASRMSKERDMLIGPNSRDRLDDLWTNEVEPAILAIKTQMHDHSLPRELAKSLGQDIKTFLAEGATLGLSFGTVTNIAGWANAIVAAAAPAAHASFQSWKASDEGRAAARQSDLFYLYEARQRLLG